MGSLGTSEGKPSAEQVLSRRGTDPFGVRGFCFPLVGGKGQRLRPYLPGTESGSDPLPVFTHPGDSGEAEAAPHSLPALPADRWVLSPPALALLQAPAGQGAPSSQVPRQPLPASQGTRRCSLLHPPAPTFLAQRRGADGVRTDRPDPRKGPGLSSPITPHPLSACVWHCRAVLAGEEA